MLNDRPSLLWFHSDKFGCGTYRCYGPALSLEDRFDSNFLMQSEVPNRGFEYLDGIDVVILQRAVGTLFLDIIAECKRRDIVVIFESDDDLFHIHKSNPSAPFWHRRSVQKVLYAQLQQVDHVITSTIPLKAAIANEGHLAGSAITVCYNHLNPHMWGEEVTGVHVQPRYLNARIDEHGTRPYRVIGWQGSATHDLDFKQALPALTRIVTEHDDVIVRFFGNVPLTVQGHIPEAKFQWSRGVSFDHYPSQLAYMNFDIGIAPVTNTKFNQAKSNLKWLEYSSIGVPTVASKVFPYATSIEHGRTGLLCDTEAEWYDALSGLLADEAARTAMGQRAKAHVWSAWGPSQAQAWADVFTRLLKERHGDDFFPGLTRSAGDGADVPAA
jgi:glycosyltransferase involved in cell wall biosynthesis